MTNVFTIPMDATINARLPKIPRNAYSTAKNCRSPRLASRMENVVKPIFLIASSTSCTREGFFTRTLIDEYTGWSPARAISRKSVGCMTCKLSARCSGRNTFARVYTELTRLVVGACKDTGVHRLHLMSSLKAGQGHSGYLRARGEAEALVKASTLDWTIYEPSTIFGPGDGLVSRFDQLLRMAPVVPLPRPQAKMAPVPYPMRMKFAIQTGNFQSGLMKWQVYPWGMRSR